MSGARAAAALFSCLAVAGCAEVTRISVVTPLGRAVPRGTQRVIFAVEPAPSPGDPGREFPARVVGGLARAFLETGRYTVLEGEEDPLGAASSWGAEGIVLEDGAGIVFYREWRSTPGEPKAVEAARRLALEARAQVVVLLRHISVAVPVQIHHLRRYRDGSASGEAAMIEARTGALAGLARGTAIASARARYSSEALVRDLLATRLAGMLARDLLYERRGNAVDLEDPADGSLRGEIEAARTGEWREAVKAWTAALDSGLRPAAAHYNLAVAGQVLGEPERARSHLESALRLAPGNPRYRKAIENLPPLVEP